jgi:outer membrane biosynthesis protein TonB
MRLNLKWALLFSVVIHVSFFALRPLIGAGTAPSQPIEVTYVVPPATVRTEPRYVRVPAEPPAKPRRAETRQQVPVNPVSSETPAAPEPVAEPEPVRLTPVIPVSPPAPEVSMPKAAASNIPESSFALIEYKKLVRQHLKNHLLFPALGLEGTVRVHMVLDGEGMLKQAAVMEASDARLADAAMEGVRSAAPYPRFPSKLKESPPNLEFLVQYRGDDLDSS